jgi:hypothetical protein
MQSQMLQAVEVIQMTKTKYNEMLQELISNCESEIRINNETYSEHFNMNDKTVKDSLVYVLSNSNIEVSADDIELLKE